MRADRMRSYVMEVIESHNDAINRPPPWRHAARCRCPVCSTPLSPRYDAAVHEKVRQRAVQSRAALQEATAARRPTSQADELLQSPRALMVPLTAFSPRNSLGYAHTSRNGSGFFPLADSRRPMSAPSAAPAQNRGRGLDARTATPDFRYLEPVRYS